MAEAVPSEDSNGALGASQGDFRSAMVFFRPFAWPFPNTFPRIEHLQGQWFHAPIPAAVGPKTGPDPISISLAGMKLAQPEEPPPPSEDSNTALTASEQRQKLRAWWSTIDFREVAKRFPALRLVVGEQDVDRLLSQTGIPRETWEQVTGSPFAGEDIPQWDYVEMAAVLQQFLHDFPQGLR